MHDGPEALREFHRILKATGKLVIEDGDFMPLGTVEILHQNGGVPNIPNAEKDTSSRRENAD
jgi:ubiquinone/menaquinone biosynthesis C-methylase UbiE